MRASGGFVVVVDIGTLVMDSIRVYRGKHFALGSCCRKLDTHDADGGGERRGETNEGERMNRRVSFNICNLQYCGTVMLIVCEARRDTDTSGV